MLDRPSSSGPDFSDPIQSRLRVVTWNLWWRYGPWQERQPAIAATLERLDADVFAFQEIWEEGATSLAAELAKPLGYHHVHRNAEKRDGVGFGNSILSRWPIVGSDGRSLPGEAESGEGRCVLFAEVKGPRGPLHVYSTHLNWKLEHSHLRQQQVTEIARFVASRERPKHPPIVCGDFNAEPTSEEIRMMTGATSCPVEDLCFRDAWRDGGDGGAGHTWDNRNPFARQELEPDRRIDYVFIGPPQEGGAGHVLDCRVVGDEPVDHVWPSDHFGVLAELRY